MSGYSLHSQGCKISSCGQRRLWSDCAHADADLSLHGSHMSEGVFSHVVAHLNADVRGQRVSRSDRKKNIGCSYIL